MIHQLTEYLSGQIAENERYRVIASADLSRVLLEQKKETYKSCFNKTCQIEIGKTLAAEKSLSTRIMHLESNCILKSILFDLAKKMSEQIATVKGGCSADDLISSMEKIAFKLKSDAPMKITKDEQKIDPALTDPSLPPIECAIANTCYRLELEHRDDKNDKDRDIDLSRAYLLQRCRKKHGAACTDLGFFFEKKKLVPENVLMTTKLYFRKCELKNTTECTNTGYMYEKGKSLQKNPARAVTYYEKNCDIDNARKCTNLGFIYHNNSDVKQNDARARELYQRACENENANECTNLDYLYETKQNTDKDMQRAINLYRKKCENNSGIDCGNLRYMYEYDRGIDRNLANAIKYYQRDCEQRNPRSCDGMKKLNKN